jgi:hypothetical protein
MNKIYVSAGLMLAAVIAAGYALATGSVSETREPVDPPHRIALAWTADTNGSVVVTSQVVRAKLTRVEFYNGTPAPGGTYAVTLKTLAGVDALAGQGSAIASNAYGSGTARIPGVLVVSTAGVTNLVTPFIVNEKLLLSVTGAGTSASPTACRQGVVVIYGE